jgi:hypothetical protein
LQGFKDERDNIESNNYTVVDRSRLSARQSQFSGQQWRYSFDEGDERSTIEASAYLHDRDLKIIFDFDKLALNRDLGFENKEFVTACAISGEVKEKSIGKLRSSLPFVCGTDYFEPIFFIEEGYKNTALIEQDDWKLF